MDAPGHLREVRSSGNGGQPQKTRTLNKCRGATALKVTEGNVRQELASGPQSHA